MLRDSFEDIIPEPIKMSRIHPCIGIAFIFYSLLLALPLPLRAQSGYLTYPMDSFTCEFPDSVFVEYDTGVIYAVCSHGVIKWNNSQVTTIYHTTRCGGGQSLHPLDGIIKDPVTGVIFASCWEQGIFAIDTSGQVDTVSSASYCSGMANAMVFPSIPSGYFFAACDTGVHRISTSNFTFETLIDTTICQPATDVTHFTENGHDFLIVVCPSAGILKLNLTDRSIETTVSTDHCELAFTVSRNANNGVLYATCFDLDGVPYALQINGTDIASVPGDDGCKPTHRIISDPRTDISYLPCETTPIAIIALFDNRTTPLVNSFQCSGPASISLVQSGVIVLCIHSGILRISSNTLTTAMSYASCTNPRAVLVDSSSENALIRCDDVFSVKNTVVTQVVSSAFCPNRGPISYGDENVFISCKNSLLMVNRRTLNHTTFPASQMGCSNVISSLYADEAAGTVYFSCSDRHGVFKLSLANENTTVMNSTTQCETVDSLGKDISANMLYVGCDDLGLMQFDLSDETFVPSVSFPDCLSPNPMTVLRGGVIYMNCFSLMFSTLVLVRINGSDIQYIDIPTCPLPSLIGHNYDTNTLFMGCYSGGAEKPENGVIAFNAETQLAIPLSSYDQCSWSPMVFQDSTMQVVWIICGNGGEVKVFNSDFKCQPGFAWSYVTQMCAPCSPNYYRPFALLKPFEQCISCPSGHVAPTSGSTSCAPCPAGSFESNKNCVLCPVGRYQPSSAATECIDCLPGSYAVEMGRTTCNLCSAGMYSASNASVSCMLCNSGSASNATGLDRPCEGCPAGSYQPAIGQQSCFPCPQHFYSEQANSTSCTRCANQVNQDRTACHIVICAANSQFNAFSNECEVCPLSQYSSRGGLCSTCVINTCTPAAGSGCAPCEGIDGLECSGGVAIVKAGYWAFIDEYSDSIWQDPANPDGIVYHKYQTVPCPFCLGTVLQMLPTVNSSESNLNSSSAVVSGSISTIQYCAFPRLNDPANALCAECEDQYLAWGDSCVECDKVNGGLVFAYLILSFILVLFLLYSSTNIGSAGYTSIFLFFIQTAALEIGPIVPYIDWFQIANLDPKSAGSCLAPWSAYVQMLFALLIPVILIAELMFIALIHFVLNRLLFPGETDQEMKDISPSRNRLVHFFEVRLRRFSIDDYYVGVLSILLFCYTQVSTASLRYLHCVDVGTFERLNFSAPTMDCRSPEYKRFLVPVIITIITYIIGLPLLSSIKLWRNKESLYIIPVDGSTSLQATMEASASFSASNPAVANFLHHWSPFYRMYHRRAYFWQCGVLLRRAAFVVTAVLLVQQPSQRFMAFAFLHLASLLVHLYFKPYEQEQLNQMDSVSYVLLLSLSLMLEGYSPPYPKSIQVLLFFLVVPPAICMFGIIILQRFRQWKQSKSDLQERQKQQQQMEQDHADDHPSHPANGVTTNGFHSSSRFEANPRESTDSVDIELVENMPHSNQTQMNQSILPAYTLDSERQEL